AIKSHKSTGAPVPVIGPFGRIGGLWLPITLVFALVAIIHTKEVVRACRSQPCHTSATRGLAGVSAVFVCEGSLKDPDPLQLPVARPYSAREVSSLNIQSAKRRRAHPCIVASSLKRDLLGSRQMALICSANP